MLDLRWTGALQNRTSALVLLVLPREDLIPDPLTPAAVPQGPGPPLPGRGCQGAADRTDVSDNVVHGHGRALHHVNDGGRGLTGGCEVTADRRLPSERAEAP